MLVTFDLFACRGRGEGGIQKLSVERWGCEEVGEGGMEVSLPRGKEVKGTPQGEEEWRGGVERRPKNLDDVIPHDSRESLGQENFEGQQGLGAL